MHLCSRQAGNPGSGNTSGLGRMALLGGANNLVKSNVRRVAMGKNSLKKIRESFLMSKAELARKARVSPITIDRIEKGKDCRLETKRKILLALGYKISEKDKVFID